METENREVEYLDITEPISIYNIDFKLHETNKVNEELTQKRLEDIFGEQNGPNYSYIF